MGRFGSALDSVGALGMILQTSGETLTFSTFSIFRSGSSQHARSGSLGTFGVLPGLWNGLPVFGNWTDEREIAAVLFYCMGSGWALTSLEGLVTESAGPQARTRVAFSCACVGGHIGVTLVV